MIAKYPPMGWNSWDCYGAAVTEDVVRRNAEYMAAHMLPFGWEYVVVDIQWYQPTASSHAYEPFGDLVMDEFGRLLPAVNRFPSAAGGMGFKPLADYVHNLGLKFGIHIMRGMPRLAAHRHLPVKGSPVGCDRIADPHSICDWNPDMYGLRCDEQGAQAYYDSIFELYAQWGVDYVKVDDVAREYEHCEREIEMICHAARNCGRDMVISLSPGPAPVEKAEHLKKYANLWRITDDFWDEWPRLFAMFERAEKWCIHAGPGHWPDADMLPMGAVRQVRSPDNHRPQWTLFTLAEQRTMLTLWCMMRSPLMMGGELTKNDAQTLAMLTNRQLLEIEKKTYCAHPLYTTAKASAWIAPVADGKGVYAAVFNLSDETQEMVLTRDEGQWGENACANELWRNEKTAAGKELRVTLDPHDAAVWYIG